MASKWSVTFNNGQTCPAFGLGTWLSNKGEVGNAVEIAIKAGYRHIDCAYIYQNEDEIGNSLQKLYKEGVVKREDIFITSKLSPFMMSTKEDVLECFEKTMADLQTDYLDLYLIHTPFAVKKGATFATLSPDNILGYNPQTIADAWKILEELVAQGKVKSIGISNFTITKTEALLKTAKIVPAVNQVECHPYLQQHKLQAYCKSKGIIFEAYSPIGSPGRFMKKENEPVLLEDPVIIEIASKYNATPAQICIVFLLHLGLIVIPKSVNESRIIQNLKATEITLNPDDIQRLKDVNRDLRYLDFTWFGSAGSTGDIMFDKEQDEAYKL